jgi:hypothetical protein
MVENPYEAEAGCGDGTAAVFFREGFAREALTPAGGVAVAGELRESFALAPRDNPPFLVF